METAVPAKKRSNYIDMVKGLSILTMFFLHFENDYIHVDYNLFLARSPSFYMIVGWLWGLSSNNRTISEHWAKRKKGLVMPYIWFSLIFLGLDLVMILLDLYPKMYFFRDVYKTLCLRGIGTLWFLPALLGGEMLFLLLRDRKRNLRTVAYIVCILFIVAYNVWYAVYPEGTVKDILNAPFRVVKDVSDCFVYLSLAYYLSRYYGKKIIGWKSGNTLLFGIVMLLIAFSCMKFALPATSDKIQYALLFLCGNVFAGIGLITTFKAMEDFHLVIKPLVYCGKNSLAIMAIHYTLLAEIFVLIDSRVFHHEVYGGGITIVYFFIALAIQVLLIEIVNRKFKFLLGK